MALTKITTGVIADGAVPTTGIVGVSTFTSSGTWTKATRESALGVTIKRVIVEMAGAGGGGGGLTSSYASGGGGGGGYAKKLLDVSSISSATITVGSGGAGGLSSGTNGSNGGSSSWSDGTNTITCTGGNGGIGVTGASYGAGGNGGTSSDGDLNISGERGGNGVYNGGDGGASYLSNTSARVYAYPATAGVLYGSGGSGALQTVQAGGAGADGIVIVTEIAG